MPNTSISPATGRWSTSSATVQDWQIPGYRLWRRARALFEIALNSNLLLVRYQPGTTTGKLFSAAISQASERAKVPAELTEPLLKLLDENASVKDVRDAVFDMHAAVDHYLSTAQP